MSEVLPRPRGLPIQRQSSTAVAPSGQTTLSVIVVIVVALYFGRDVLLPLTLAILLSILLAPLVGLLRRLRLGRIPSVLMAVLLAVGVIVAIGGLIGSQIVDLAGKVPAYAHTIQGKAAAVRGFATSQLSHFVDSEKGQTASPAPVNAPAQQSAPTSDTQPASQPSPLAPLSGNTDAQKPVPVEVHQPDPSPIELAQRYLTPILSPMATAGIVFVVAIFVLLQQEDLRDRLIRLFGSNDLRRTTLALDDGGRRLSRYFLTQLGINTSFGTIIGLGLLLIGVPSPLLWAVFAGLLRFVPYVGSFIAAVFPLALAAAVDPGWSMIIWTGTLFFVVEVATGQMIEPLVYGSSTGLSPISVVVAAIFWSWLWGPVGLILSTPLSLCLVVLGRHVERLKFLDIMLGDRPALTPIESFYQRMLSGDQDEARYHAEQMLKERSLTVYYDDIALPGLELAAIDSQRGMLNDDQLDRVKETITELVADLADHEDRAVDVAAESEPLNAPKDDRGLPRLPMIAAAKIEPETAWHKDAQVLCVAGRGPLDEPVASMLSQLLAKRGISAQIAAYASVTRGNINLLDVTNVEIICVSYLDMSGRQAHLRYLLQRLRQRLPDAPILVGLWPEDQPVIKDRNIDPISGPNYYTNSLRDTLDKCQEIVRKSIVDPNLAKASA